MGVYAHLTIERQIIGFRDLKAALPISSLVGHSAYAQLLPFRTVRRLLECGLSFSFKRCSGSHFCTNPKTSGMAKLQPMSKAGLLRAGHPHGSAWSSYERLAKPSTHSLLCRDKSPLWPVDFGMTTISSIKPTFPFGSSQRGHGVSCDCGLRSQHLTGLMVNPISTVCRSASF
jgi:hypothetical protein